MQINTEKLQEVIRKIKDYCLGFKYLSPCCITPKPEKKQYMA